MKSPHTGIKGIVKAFVYSKEGFVATFKSEASFRQDLLFCGLMLIVALFIPVMPAFKGMLISSLLLILLMELINTAIETVIDRISDGYNILSKKAKDIGSLLVLLSFINFGVIWVYVLYQWWFNSFQFLSKQ
jgi:diacylglycerol kinase (ATP)